MQYDTLGRVTTSYQAFGHPEQKVTAFGYNDAGHKTKVIKFDGTIIHYTHDVLGRVATMTSTDNTIAYEYTYDLNDNVISIVDAIQGTSTVKKYYSHNYLIEETLGNGQRLIFDNDKLGRMTKVTLSDSTAIEYEYDGSRLKHIRRLDADGNSSYSHSYDEYDLAGKVTKTTLAADSGSMHYSYDKCGRLKNIESDTWKQTVDAYDKAGNITGKTTTINDDMEIYRYRYDPLYQLIAEEGPQRHAYTYDSHYNRLSKNGLTCAYNALDQMSSDGKHSYSYDLNGNLIKKDSDTQYTYDAFDRLLTVTQNDQMTRYVYDDSHRRLSKISCNKINGTWKETKRLNFLYQGQNDIGAVDAAGKIIELRLLGSGKGAEIGSAVAMEIDGTMYVPIHDHNGNVAALLDGASGKIVESYSFTAFGEYAGSALSPWLFSSKRFDAETGFVYFGRRYYDPATARWITEDPLGREAGSNRYSYVHNNPLTHIDLYGLLGQGNFSYMDSFQRSCGRLCNGMQRFFDTVARLPGKVVEAVGHHFVPIPYVKDAVAFIGHCLAGQNPYEFTPDWKLPHSQHLAFEGYGELDPLQRDVFNNGIMTSLDDFKSYLGDMSKKLGGKTVYGVYNSSRGLVLDLFEVMCQKMGIPTHSQEIAERSMQYHLNEMDQHGKNGVINMRTHSQGAEIVYNLSHEVRHRINVSAFGPARILENRDFKTAHNYISKLDPIPWIADPIGFARGYANGYIMLLNPHGKCPYMNHGISQPVYGGIIKQDGNKYKTTHGSVETMGY